MKVILTTFVSGYELINEPFAGNIYESLSIVLPGLAGNLNLAPLYEKAAASIREVDSETIIFYEPLVWGVFSPSHQNGILDTILIDSLDALSIFDVETVISQVCGPMEQNVTFEHLIKHKKPMVDVPALSTGFKHVPGT